MKYDFNTLHLLWAIRNIPSETLNSQEKLILYTLLACTGAKNDSWNSQIKLSKMCGLSESSIKRTLKSLVQKSFISIVRPAQNSRTATNHYHLNIDYILSLNNEHTGSTQNPELFERGPQGTLTGSTQTYERGPHRPLKKEIEERKKNGAVRPPDEGATRLPQEPDEKPGVPAPQWFKDFMKDLREKRKRDSNQTHH